MIAVATARWRAAGDPALVYRLMDLETVYNMTASAARGPSACAARRAT
jgi:hypothetical protein